MLHIVTSFTRLRWRLLRGGIRRGGADQVGVVLSTVGSAIVGLGGGALLGSLGHRVGELSELTIIACTVIMVGVLGFGVVAGVSQPIDPRVIAAEPLSDRDRAIGILTAAAIGPPGMAGMLLGFGLVIASLRGPETIPVVIVGVMAWLCSLLLVARTATNVLAVLVARFPRAGQLTVGLCGLGFYGVMQFVPAIIGDLEEERRRQLTDALAFNPAGQLGEALSLGAGRSAWIHLALGAAWLPFLGLAFAATTTHLVRSVRTTGGGTATQLGFVARSARRLCGSGAIGAIAWRSVITRLRSSRGLLETVTGAGVGLGAALAPALLTDTPGSGAVLVGGAVQLAVLFMAGNSFGSDGPPITLELLAGATPTILARGKARSIALIAAPLSLIGPTIAAALTSEWQYLVAGIGVGIGGLLAGTGAALVQSALVPIAIPESDNPFASGESGKGIVAALLLVAVLSLLAVVTVPVALVLFWATDRANVGLVTVCGALTIAVGWAVMRGGAWFAARHIGRREPEFAAAVTPHR